MHAPNQVGQCLMSCSTQRPGETMATLVGDAFVCSSQLAHSFVLCAGMYFDRPEIVPDGLQGDFRFNKANEAVAR